MPKPYFQSNESLIASIVMVDHAGEYGAVRIYNGQIDAAKDKNTKQLLSHMLKQEEKHLEFFSCQIQKRNTRPTIFLPLWHAAGYMLGFITSWCGPKTAMLCTQAVEEVIDEHYSNQVRDLQFMEHEQSLMLKIEEYRLEELEHRDTALYNGSLNAPLYQILHTTIRAMCKVAIALSKRY